MSTGVRLLGQTVAHNTEKRFFRIEGLCIEDVQSYGEGEAAFWLGYADICGIRFLVSNVGTDIQTLGEWDIEGFDALPNVAPSVKGIEDAAAQHAKLLGYQDTAKALAKPIKQNIDEQVAAFRAQLEAAHAIPLALAELTDSAVEAHKEALTLATVEVWTGQEEQGKSFANGGVTLREYSRVQHFDAEKAKEYALEHFKAAVIVDKVKFEQAAGAGLINPDESIIKFGKSYGIAITRSKLPSEGQAE
jgi:hypothetical protein